MLKTKKAGTLMAKVGKYDVVASSINEFFG